MTTLKISQQRFEILLVAPLPPPIGGYSVHAKRLYQSLKDLNHQVKVLDYLSNKQSRLNDDIITLPSNCFYKAFSLILLSLKLKSSVIVHIHVSAMKRFKLLFPIFLLLFWAQPKIITIHGGRFGKQSHGSILTWYLRWLLNHFHKIIVVSELQARYLKKVGILEKNIIIINAFISQNPDINKIPPVISNILGLKKLVLTSGYLIPLYNYDILIDCISQLKGEDYHFVFAFYKETDPYYEKKICARLSKFDNITILHDESPEVFVTIVSVCDIYVRSTNIDGDAVAIREALSFGKIVFASDCVPRPTASHLFSPSKSESLLRLFRRVSNNKINPVKDIGPKNVDLILQEYANLMEINNSINKI